MNQVGWWNPEPFRKNSKFHYVDEDGVSLCTKWLHLRGDIEQGKNDRPDNCKECCRELAKRRAKEVRT